MEPKEHLPRILVEMFEIYGDSTIATNVESYFESNGIKYINIKVQDDVLQLPSCSLEVCEEAYLLPAPKGAACNTEKQRIDFIIGLAAFW